VPPSRDSRPILHSRPLARCDRHQSFQSAHIVALGLVVEIRRVAWVVAGLQQGVVVLELLLRLLTLLLLRLLMWWPLLRWRLLRYQQMGRLDVCVRLNAA